jgi:hypothetical protein
VRDEPIHKAILGSFIKRRPADADFDVAELYPESEGWAPVFNAQGQRSGFMHHAHGFKDDPANLVGGNSTAAIDAYVDGDPDVIAARAACAKAEDDYVEANERWQAAVQGFAERNLLRQLEIERVVSPGSFAMNPKIHRDAITDEAESERSHAEERVRRKRVAVTLADAIARKRYTRGER